jgi:hypothetical protein
MVTMWNGHRDYLNFSASAHPGDEHPPAPGKMIYWLPFSVTHPLLAVGCGSMRFLF